MSKKMFCFQCEQTVGGIGCRNEIGVCGKKAETAKLQDKLTGALITFGSAIFSGHLPNTEKNQNLIITGLYYTVTNVNFDNKSISKLIEEIEKLLHGLPKHNCQFCNKFITSHKIFDMEFFWSLDEDIRSLKALILFGIRGIAAYAYNCKNLNAYSPTVNNFFSKALYALQSDFSITELLTIVLEAGKINLEVMQLLDKGNTSLYGKPIPTEVSMRIEKGPFIVVSGHDLLDLQELLEQTKDKGINIYTHGEMLPAHGYPGLKAYSHLKGHFGTAWQNQQKEFENLPAPILFTTNCIMTPKSSYEDRVFTTGPVHFPNTKHIDNKPFSEVYKESYKDKNLKINFTEIVNRRKDFSPIIEKAIELGGYNRDVELFGINDGDTLTTGFGHATVLSVADKIIEGIEEGKIKHIFLVGGCDGAKPGRNYYTDFVKSTPKDTLILTCGCGKYRFNDLELGTVAGLPRLMDMGQCNDSYSAIKVAQTLANHYNCSINELPLTFVLSWYEQKAVAILLTLLFLGIRGIYLGPSLPAFISPKVLGYLIDNFDIHPTSNAKKDMEKMLS